MVLFAAVLVCVFQQYMVIIPLVVNVTGFFVSLLIRPVSDRIGKKVCICLDSASRQFSNHWSLFIACSPCRFQEL